MWFRINLIFFFRWRVNLIFIFFVFMFFVQVSCTTISIAWRIASFACMGITCLIICTTFVVFLIFIWRWSQYWWGFFTSMLLPTFSPLLIFSGSWVILFKFLVVSLFFFLGIRSLSIDTNIVEKLQSSRANLFALIFITFGSCSSIIYHLNWLMVMIYF